MNSAVSEASFTMFFSGVATAAFAASAIFFFKFWRASRDRFFLLFGVACVMISLQHIVAIFVRAMFDNLRTPDTEHVAWVYIIRLAAFFAIALAIWEKNRPRPNP